MLEHNSQDLLDAVRPGGGLVDVWIMDDQTIICDPTLVNSIIDADDVACQGPSRGGVRNRVKTHVILYATPEQHQQQHTWNLSAAQQKTTLHAPTDDLEQPWGGHNDDATPSAHE